MASPRSKSRPQVSKGPEIRRLWLNYPPRAITRPLIWELARKFDVVFNIRQASVSDEIGILCLELKGEREILKKAIQWLEKHGIRVEPVEIGVIEA